MTSPAFPNDYRANLTEYTRPWKLATLALGMLLLILGVFYTPAPDWDVPICFIMGLLTYLAAPWCAWVFIERRWRRLPLVLLLSWFSVDGAYALYWGLKDPAVLDAMRAANFRTSLPLYGLCGAGWMYRGSLAQLSHDLRRALRRAPDAG